MKVRVADIKAAVSDHFKLTISDMESHTRKRLVSWPRQTAFLLAQDLTSKNISEIGRLFGRRHHTTIIHGIKRARERVASDPKWAEHYAALKARLA